MKEEFKIGCDPEFICSRDGKIIPANRLVRNGDFGYDGHPTTGELRPKAANGALKVVANIKKLFAEARQIELLDDVQLLAGHYKHSEPIGGHIHLSGFDMDSGVLSGHLDDVLGTLSDCIDNLDERQERRERGYGSGYRMQGINWIEYRAPGSWLLSPQVAFMNLWLAEATAYAYVLDRKAAFEALKLHGACDGIMRFAIAMRDVPEHETFIRVADRVFSSLPLDWDVDIKRYWN